MASSMGAGMFSGNTARAKAIWAFNTRVKSRCCAAVGVPMGITRVMSVVPP